MTCIPSCKYSISSASFYRRPTRSDDAASQRLPSPDLREHRLFHTDVAVHADCCPTVTELTERRFAVNYQGLVVELLRADNFTQTFYETICSTAVKDAPCRFIDRRYRSTCVQQYQYVYAVGRLYGHVHEPHRIDFIRVATGCKCTVMKSSLTSSSSPRRSGTRRRRPQMRKSDLMNGNEVERKPY